MLYKASRKVGGGKLVRVEVSVQDGLVSAVKITGDFFLHPEERLSQIEECFKGLSIGLDVEQMFEKLIKCLEGKGDFTLYGVSLRDMAEVVREALGNNF